MDEESILLNLETEHYHELDEVGTRTWELIADNVDLDGIVARLLEEYEVDEVTLRDDLNDLIARLNEEGLIHVHG